MKPARIGAGRRRTTLAGVVAGASALVMAVSGVGGAVAAPSGGGTGRTATVAEEAEDPTPKERPNWKVDMVEDFAKIDRDRWNIRDNTSNSNEHSYLLAENSFAKGGKLHIKAKNESAGGRRWTSGYIDTNGNYSLPNQFRIKIRAKVPMEQGMWAAPLWLRPADYSGGEIDLVETYGRERHRPLVHQTIHTDYGSGHQQDVEEIPYSNFDDPDGTGWHTYVVVKTKNSIRMKVDGVQTAKWSSGDPSWFDRYYKAGKRWSLRVNLQVGGDWGGQPDQSTDWRKTTMMVDYIHTWVPKD